jgi:hypothetical protein
MLTEASCHRDPARRVFVHEFFEVFFTDDFHFFSLDGEVCAKDTSGNSSTVSTVAEVTSPMAGEEFRVDHFDGDRATQAMSLHLRC